MNFDVIQNTVDKSLLLENTSQSILDCNLQINILQQHYSRLKISFPLHSSANFRDSQIHYEKLYATLLNVEGACQKYAFDEHLQRCIKDACVTLANTYLEILTCILESNTLNQKRDEAFLRNREQSENECGFIFAASPEFKDEPSFWTIENIYKLHLDLSNAFFVSLKDKVNDNERARNFYFKYITSCLFDYYKYSGFNWFKIDEIDEIRKLVHQLSNHVLEIRSMSTDLVKSYQNHNKNSFSEFIDISDKAYTFMKEHYLLGLVFFNILKHSL